MAYKMALLCLLLTLGCASMASARSLTQTYATDEKSCYIYNYCGWKTASNCPPGPWSAPISTTPVALIVNAVVNVIVIGKIEALAAVVALLRLIISIDVTLCANVIIALIANVTVGVKICAHAFLQLCALVKGDLIARLCVILKVDILVKLIVALGTGGAVKLLVALFALLQLQVTGYVTVLTACCNGLYLIGTVWVNVIAQACLEIGVTICGPLLLALRGLNVTCLNAVLNACSSLPGGTVFVCACNSLLKIDILGLISLCINLG